MKNLHAVPYPIPYQQTSPDLRIWPESSSGSRFTNSRDNPPTCLLPALFLTCSCCLRQGLSVPQGQLRAARGTPLPRATNIPERSYKIYFPKLPGHKHCPEGRESYVSFPSNKEKHFFFKEEEIEIHF